MKFAAAAGHRSGRATPSLRDAPQRQSMERIGRESIYRDRNAVQTNPATSLGQLVLDAYRTEFASAPVVAMHSAINFLARNAQFLPDMQRRKDACVLSDILEVLSLFSTPVEPSVFAIAFRNIYRGHVASGYTNRDWEKVFDYLHKATNLVLKLAHTNDEYSQTRYTAHTLVRRAVLRRLGGRPDRPAEIQQFDVNDFASEPPEVQSLTAETAKRLLLAFDRIIEDAEAIQKGPVVGNRRSRVRSRLRAAYGILRGGWSATGIGRFLSGNASQQFDESGPLYRVYHRRLTRLLNLVYAHGAPPESHDDWERDDASLYPDELGWLLNELGLVCASQGALADALTFFGMGQRLNRRTEGNDAGYRSVVARINRASVLIEFARLRQGRDLLNQAATLARGLGDSARELRARIHGYMGLITHLSGDAQSAVQLYDDAILNLRKLHSWRGVSIFSRHKCDLLRGEKQFSNAEIALREAISAAESGFHPDLVHYCRISEANLLRESQREKKLAKPSMLTPTLHFAKVIGSAKIESDVYRIRGLIELENGDLEAATRSTMECLSISRSNGLRLRMMSSMELLGRLFAERGYIEEARAIFRTVIQMGQIYEYERPMESAQTQLASLERT